MIRNIITSRIPLTKYEAICPDHESQLTGCHYSFLHQPPEQNHQQVSNNLLEIFGQAIVKISALGNFGKQQEDAVMILVSIQVTWLRM
jgi:hypothetical protein